MTRTNTNQKTERAEEQDPEGNYTKTSQINSFYSNVHVERARPERDREDKDLGAGPCAAARGVGKGPRTRQGGPQQIKVV